MDDSKISDIGREIGMDTIELPTESFEKFELTGEELEAIDEISSEAEKEGINLSDLEKNEDKKYAPSFGSSCSAGCAGSCEGNCVSTCADSCYNRCLSSYSS